jgi:hypothetical protein
MNGENGRERETECERKKERQRERENKFKNMKGLTGSCQFHYFLILFLSFGLDKDNNYLSNKN